ncbi:hypothetical protein ACH495_25490 [Micromonospora sp. NPDC018662]|uniref:hypothetical protein n=1 Tax=Micromonospora sp. NPDC018662 TaxID=3364238 RepID=UPI0037B07C97
MTALRIELRRGPGLWSLPVLVVIGVFAARAELRTDTIWSYATGAATSAPMLMAPLAVGLAAWAGARSQRRGVRQAWLLAGREPAQAPLVEVGVLVVCAIAAYVTVVAATLLPTAVTATWGGPLWWWLIAAGAGLAAVVAIGYGVGVLAPGRLTPFAAAVVTYLATTWNLGQNGSWWHALFPVTVAKIFPFNAPHVQTMRGQVLWFAGLGLATLALVAVKVRSSARLMMPAAGASLALLAAGAAVVVNEGGRYVDLNRHIVWSCEGTTPQVCIHPAYANSLTAISQRAAAISDRLASTPFAIARVEQRPRGVGSRPTAGAIAYALDAPAADDYDRAGLDIAIAALGVRACGRGPVRDTDAHAMAQLLVAWVVGDERLFVPRSLEQRQVKSRFLAMGLKDQQRWLTVHAAAVRSCALSPQSVP